MEKHAPRWNGIGYVQSEYEGRTCMSSAMTEANFIIKYMHQYKTGSQMVLHFRYEDEFDVGLFGRYAPSLRLLQTVDLLTPK